MIHRGPQPGHGCGRRIRAAAAGGIPGRAESAICGYVPTGVGVASPGGPEVQRACAPRGGRARHERGV